MHTKGLIMGLGFNVYKEGNRVTETEANITGGISRTDAAAITVAFASVLLLVIFPVHNFDIFWHMANGKAMLQEHRIVNEEIFSYTAAGRELTNHEWLSQILFYYIYEHAGVNGLIAFKVVIALSVALLIFRTARFAGADIPTASMLVALVFLSSFKRYTARPQLFSFLFLSLLGYVLYGVRAGRLGRLSLLAVPPIMVLWDFLHGAVYGTIFLAAYVLGETIKGRPGGDVTEAQAGRLKALWWAAGAALAAMLLNPYGLRTYGRFLIYADKSLEVINYSEFMTTPVVEFGLFWFLLGFAFVLGAVFIRKIDVTHVLVLLPFAVLAIKYNRATTSFCIVVVPVLSYYMSLVSRELGSVTEQKWFRGYSYILLTAVAAAMLFVKVLSGSYAYSLGGGFYAKHYPTGAVEFVKKSGLKGNMYNRGHIGGYLAYTLFPERKIFLYNHANVFGDVTRDLWKEDLVDKYDIEYAFLVNYPKGFTDISLKEGEWIKAYDDGNTSVLIRNTPENAPFLKTR